MKSYIKILKTKREISEMLIDHLSQDLPEEIKQRAIEKAIVMPQSQFMKTLKQLRELNIVPFINNTYLIRYEIY